MTGEDWVIVAVVGAWLIARLAQILASYRTSRRNAELKAGKVAAS